MVLNGTGRKTSRGAPAADVSGPPGSWIDRGAYLVRRRINIAAVSGRGGAVRPCAPRRSGSERGKRRVVAFDLTRFRKATTADLVERHAPVVGARAGRRRGGPCQGDSQSWYRWRMREPNHVEKRGERARQPDRPTPRIAVLRASASAARRSKWVPTDSGCCLRLPDGALCWHSFESGLAPLPTAICNPLCPPWVRTPRAPASLASRRTGTQARPSPSLTSRRLRVPRRQEEQT